jgi:peptidoglycan/LPS O-acetylase OafA/YrhL
MVETGINEAQRAPAPVTAAKTTIAATQKNLSIQCLRGVAALFVVLYHASFYSGLRFGNSSWATAFDGRFGLVGVAIFFAISGLLMAELIQRTDPWRFLAHRIVRIYPTYLLAVSVGLPIVALAGKSVGLRLWSLMLVPAGQRKYYLGVEWTLVFECTYYVALFFLARIGWHRHLNGIVLVWIVLIGAAPFFIGWSDDVLYPVYSILFSPANAAFMGGLLIPWFVSRKIRFPVGIGILALCILMVALPTNPTIARWTAGVVATLLVMDIARIDVPRRALVGLSRLGDWSYGLYLCHVPCILLLYQIWPSSFGVGTAWFSAVAIALFVSAILGSIDVRMYRYFKGAVDHAGEDHRRRLVDIYAGAFVVAALIGSVWL